MLNNPPFGEASLNNLPGIRNNGVDVLDLPKCFILEYKKYREYEVLRMSSLNHDEVEYRNTLESSRYLKLQ